MNGPDPVRSCTEKQAYPSEADAVSVANGVWLKRWVSLRAYFCDLCKGWHLTKLGAPVRDKPGFRPALRPLRQQRRYEERRRRRERGRG